MKISFLTNGFGEDRTGALIACELRRLAPEHPIVAIPMVSSGNDFQKHGFETVWKALFRRGRGLAARNFACF